MFEIGKTYQRQNDIHGRYGGNRQSGIAPCADHPYVFLFSSPAGERYGYKDGWLTTTQYAYTGEGQIGDMEMARGNRAIKEHAAGGRELHFFEKTDESGYYQYLGPFRYVRHEIRRGDDLDGGQRSQIVFTLHRVE